MANIFRTISVTSIFYSDLVGVGGGGLYFMELRENYRELSTRVIFILIPILAQYSEFVSIIPFEYMIYS